LIVETEAATEHASADDHGFGVTKNSRVVVLGARVSGQRRRLRKTAGELNSQGAKSVEPAKSAGSERRMSDAVCEQDTLDGIALSLSFAAAASSFHSSNAARIE
jgi:hypothetical protein